MLDETDQKLCIRTKKVINRGKRSKTLSKEKLAENISRNPEFPRDKFHAKGSLSFT